MTHVRTSEGYDVKVPSNGQVNLNTVLGALGTAGFVGLNLKDIVGGLYRLEDLRETTAREGSTGVPASPTWGSRHNDGKPKPSRGVGVGSPNYLHLLLLSATLLKMYKTHAFAQLLDIVERVTEIERADILGHAKNQEIVDARHMFVYALHSLAGLSTAYIAAHTPYSDEGVRKMIVGFDDRYQHSPKLFAILYEQICHAYATN